MLSNGNVSLRPIERRDLDKLNQWKNDESVYRFLGGGFLPVSRDIQEKWLDSLMDTTGNSKRFMIENDVGEAVGMIGLYGINWVHRTCELGIFIGDGSQRGKGYASSAYRLLEAYGAMYLNLRKVTADVVDKNDAAGSFYENLHFRQAGRLSKQRFIGGEYCDLLIMEKFLGDKEEWGGCCSKGGGYFTLRKSPRSGWFWSWGFKTAAYLWEKPGKVGEAA